MQKYKGGDQHPKQSQVRRKIQILQWVLVESVLGVCGLCCHSSTSAPWSPLPEMLSQAEAHSGCL